MKTLLVTGGAGFIGGNFIHFLDRMKTVSVIILDKLTYAGHLETLGSLANGPRHCFVRGDIGDRALVAELLRVHHPAAIIHFAAESHVDRSIDGPAAFIQTNVVGTFELLQAALNHWRGLSGEEQTRFRFLHVSTDEVYGSLGPVGRFSEETPYAPNSPYSASKAASDHLVRAWHHTYGLPTLTTNCSNNYGPYQFPEKLIPLCLHRALAGEPLPLYGDGGNIRDWLYVEDHCRAIWTVLDHGQPGEIYNIGGDAERSNLQVVDSLCRLLDERLPDSPYRPHARLKTFVTDRPGHDRRYAMNATKIRQRLCWRPEESFETGLARTVDWYLAHPDWAQTVTRDRDQGQRLGNLTQGMGGMRP
ncbi:dTDP-glucose 4,6-dehydratase 2 [Gammaproteobacteria bacterium]